MQIYDKEVNMQIYDIDFSCPYDEFMKEFQEYLNIEYGTMIVSCTELSTRNGKNVYSFEVSCDNNPNTTTIVFEKSPVDSSVTLTKSGFAKFNGNFYKIDNLDNDIKGTHADTSMALTGFLVELARRKTGKIVCKDSDNTIFCIVNGKRKIAKECIVDVNGNVYGAKNKTTYTALFDETESVSYDTKLLDWNKERRKVDPNYASILTDKSTTIVEKYNLIGKYLVELKLKGELTPNEFKDLFLQAGAADSYVNYKTLNSIYQLLKN